MAPQGSSLTCLDRRPIGTFYDGVLSGLSTAAGQADVMWIKVQDNKFPVMSIVDEGTRFQAASLITSEKSEHYIQILERNWVAHFGPPAKLITDEGRGWLSEEFEQWSNAKAIHHVVAAGESHTEIALVERRHAILRKAVEVYMADLELQGANGIREALVYVVPQMNASPTVAGYSPSQWVLGQQPHFPGDLLNDHVTPLHLGGVRSFEDELLRRTTAKMALVQSDADQKLRRALLRKYAGTNVPLEVGQTCFFWRDAKATDLVKIRWKGPALVVMKEVDEENKPKIYWVAHKTQLIRCAPHHVRAEIGANKENLVASLETAKDRLRQLRSRGVTRYIDLNVANRRRNLDDVGSEDEMLHDGDTDDGDPGAGRNVRRRLVDPEHLAEDWNDDMYSPSIAPAPQPPTTPPLALLDAPHVEDPPQSEPPLADAAGLPVSPDVRSQAEPVQEPSPTNDVPEVIPADAPSETAAPRVPSPRPQLDPETAALYQPAGPEDFRAQRQRFQRQETLQFAPWRSRMASDLEADSSRATRPGPYEKPANAEDALSVYDTAFEVEDMDSENLPPGWKIENGYIQLESEMSDYWEVKAGCLLRHHLVPRRTLFDPKTMNQKELKFLPIPIEKLDRTRVSVVRRGQRLSHHIDSLDDGPGLADAVPWTGVTVFQIGDATRRELGMTVNDVGTAKQTARKQKTHLERKARKENPNDHE